MTSELHRTDRSRVRRGARRADYDRAVVDPILDEAFIAHVGVATESGPVVLPMAYGRVDDVLYLHGAAANHLLAEMAGRETCVTVTLVDGVVLARSAFHHSANYRSVVLFGIAELVVDDAEKRCALDAIVDQVTPGRSADARPANAAELRKTSVVRLPVAEGSAKIRTGGPVDDPEDLELDIWAGHVPLTMTAAAPVPAADLPTGLVLPGYAATYRRPTVPNDAG